MLQVDFRGRGGQGRFRILGVVVWGCVFRVLGSRCRVRGSVWIGSDREVDQQPVTSPPAWPA